MSDDRIQCKQCSRKIVPRLFRHGGSLLHNPTLQHMCPYCGTCQYETGGQITATGKFVLWALLAMSAIGILRGLFR